MVEKVIGTSAATNTTMTMQAKFISKKALFQRINRKLASSRLVLRTSRGSRARADYGEHFVVDLDVNLVVDRHQDPDELGRDLGVLAKWEYMAQPE